MVWDYPDGSQRIETVKSLKAIGELLTDKEKQLVAGEGNSIRDMRMVISRRWPKT